MFIWACICESFNCPNLSVAIGSRHGPIRPQHMDGGSRRTVIAAIGYIIAAQGVLQSEQVVWSGRRTPRALSGHHSIVISSLAPGN